MKREFVISNASLTCLPTSTFDVIQAENLQIWTLHHLQPISHGYTAKIIQEIKGFTTISSFNFNIKAWNDSRPQLILSITCVMRFLPFTKNLALQFSLKFQNLFIDVNASCWWPAANALCVLVITNIATLQILL